MTYEEKMRMLTWVKPEKKDILLARILAGERVNITKDDDLFFQINRDRLPIEKQVERDKYQPIVDHVKASRHLMKNGKHMKYKGEIPADLYFTHPWFSPMLPKHERDANIKKFFELFPDFSAKGQ